VRSEVGLEEEGENGGGGGGRRRWRSDGRTRGHGGGAGRAGERELEGLVGRLE